MMKNLPAIQEPGFNPWVGTQFNTFFKMEMICLLSDHSELKTEIKKQIARKSPNMWIISLDKKQHMYK